MRFNRGADLRPTRGVDPDTAILYRELCGGRIFDKFWQSRRALSSFFAVAGDQFCKPRRDHGWRIGFAITLDRRRELRMRLQNLDARSSVLPPSRITAGMFNSISQNAFASP